MFKNKECRKSVKNMKDKKYGVIYCAINIYNKKYIGKTMCSLETRIKKHITNSVSKSPTLFGKALSKLNYYNNYIFKYIIIKTKRCIYINTY